MNGRTLGCLITLVVLATFQRAAAQRTVPTPNIVWLVTEDNSIHYMRLYREEGVAMPRLEELAARGLVFENAYSQAPVCSVARSTLISGMYAPRVGAQYHRRVEPVPMPGGSKMFPAYLRGAGYYTANNSKEDYNILVTPGTWDDSSPQADYRDRAPGQPFFYVRNFGETHESSLHFPEADTLTVITTDDPATVEVFPGHPDDTAFRYTRARYADRHRLVDSLIGRELDRLEEDGLMDSTIIFVYGDHGGVLPGSKGYLYETGLHVPLVVYVPPAYRDLNPYGEDTRPTTIARFMDFGPTVLALAGIEPPRGMDGRAFLGATAAPVPTERDTVYSYADRFDAKADFVRAVRIGRYKYLRSYQPYLPDGLYNDYRYRMWAYRDWLGAYRAGRLDSLQSRFFRARPPEQLFDVVADPFETINLLDRSEFAEVAESLRRALAEKIDGLPDLSFIPEAIFLEEGIDDPVAYGRANRARIRQLRQVADLQLVSFGEAAADLRAALAASDPLKRYWGLTVASSFGVAADSLSAVATTLLSEDNGLLVRLRAAEFLGIIRAIDPRPVLVNLLTATGTPAEATAVLNTMAFFKFEHPEWKWDIPTDVLPGQWLEDASGRKENAGRLLGWFWE